MDQLVNVKGTEVVYSLFKWSRTPGSRLIIIGIANALDLTVRHLPLLAAIHSPSPATSPKGSTPKGRRPKTESTTRTSELSQEISATMKVLNFAPYDRSDIEKILEARLTEIGSNIFEPTAIKFVAAKVAATTGDMRKALNACKLALDAVEKQQRHILKSTADDGELDNKIII
jgi:cell division control protein 6